MARWFEDFCYYHHTGYIKPPERWTKRWDGGNWRIGSGYSGGRYLQIYNHSGSDYRCISWDYVGSPTDVEIAARCKIYNYGAVIEHYLIARGAGGSSDRTGYFVNFYSQNLEVGKFKSGARTVLASKGSVLDPTEMHWIRFRVEGPYLKAKAWLTSGSEPTDWQIVAADADITGGGWVGFGAYYFYNTSYWYLLDDIGVGTDGDPAPTSFGFASIQGTVTLNGDPVEGAKVIAVRQNLPIAYNNGILIPSLDVAQDTTDANGNYSIPINTDADPWVAVVVYKAGGVVYTDIAKPYIQPQ